MIRILPLVLVLGCNGLWLPSSASLEAAPPPDPRCVSADADYRAWHAVGVIFTSLGAATSGGAVVTEFLTDEEWAPAAISIGGIVFGGLGLAGNLLADDAAEDVMRYCGEER